MSNDLVYPSDRIRSIDYLRGIMAFTVMIYHYFIWSSHRLDADSLLARFTYYIVPAFFTVSGLTLYIVYKQKLTGTFKSLSSFFISRFFKIYPLLWVTMTAALVIAFVMYHNFPGRWLLFINYTGVFSFISPGEYIAVGQWSIGNELVFYTIFPLLLFLSRKRPVFFIIVFILTFLIGAYYAFYVLTPQKTMQQQWVAYVNPLNNIMFFSGGVFIGYIKQFIAVTKNNRKFILTGLLVSLSFFILYPAQSAITNDKIAFATGFNRLFLTIACLLICFCFYLYGITLPRLIEKPFLFLGLSSYSLYMLHPIVYKTIALLNQRYFHISIESCAVLSGVASVFVSYISYKIIEKPFMALGKKLIYRI